MTNVKGTSKYIYINFVIRILYLTTCIIFQDGSGSAEHQPRATDHPSGSGEDPSEYEIVFTKDSPKVPQRWWARRSHYVTPPSVPTNPEARPIIKQSVRGNHFLFSIYNGYSC
jgi:hypothetical protein